MINWENFCFSNEKIINRYCFHSRFSVSKYSVRNLKIMGNALMYKIWSLIK